MLPRSHQILLHYCREGVEYAIDNVRVGVYAELVRGGFVQADLLEGRTRIEITDLGRKALAWRLPGTMDQADILFEIMDLERYAESTLLLDRITELREELRRRAV